MKVQSFYDAAHIARRLGVTRATVLGWASKPTARFPIPVAVLKADGGKDRPLWLESQIPELRIWLAARLNLSNPEAHWNLVDRKIDQPGGHQDQMPMFDMPRKVEDGLFAASAPGNFGKVET